MNAEDITTVEECDKAIVEAAVGWWANRWSAYEDLMSLCARRKELMRKPRFEIVRLSGHWSVVEQAGAFETVARALSLVNARRLVAALSAHEGAWAE